MSVADYMSDFEQATGTDIGAGAPIPRGGDDDAPNAVAVARKRAVLSLG